MVRWRGHSSSTCIDYLLREHPGVFHRQPSKWGDVASRKETRPKRPFQDGGIRNSSRMALFNPRERPDRSAHSRTAASGTLRGWRTSTPERDQTEASIQGRRHQVFFEDEVILDVERYEREVSNDSKGWGQTNGAKIAVTIEKKWNTQDWGQRATVSFMSISSLLRRRTIVLLLLLLLEAPPFLFYKSIRVNQPSSRPTK